MNALFADTSFFVAFLNPRDENHARAAEFMEDFTGRIITTSSVLIELGNYLGKGPHRRLFLPFVEDLRADTRLGIEPVDEPLFQAGANLYDRRPDKEWSMTDCISFVVMQEQGVNQALTADHHFEQAGFGVLFK